ncbi:MAG: MATE family efflux transporter [Lachnospiraceae bacterium]|nr:MATE family efflux transporter [Lachnospiraceae bacterium]MDE6184749.1 MATE family efflux transporter [Lachnospiraceae bacterium]
MTTTPIPKLVCSLAVPTIISMLVTSFYNMADTFFVGKLDTQSTAAVGVVFSVMAIIQAVGFFFGHGSGNYISRKLGSKELEDASAMAANGFYLSLLSGILIAVCGILFLNPLSVALGSTPTILPYTKKYLRIILLGAPFMTSSLVLNNQLRFQGRASFAMVGIVTGAVLNIVLDPILILSFHMGVSGAAIATVTSQLSSFVLLVVMTRKGGSIVISYKNLKINSYFLKEIFRGGIPSLCRQGLASIAVIFLNHAAGVYGDAAIAGMSIVNRVTMFANSALIGFGQGFQPVCGFNYGAGLFKRVREGFFFCVKYAFVFLIFISALCGIFAPNIVALFRKEDQAVIETGALALRLQCITFPLNAWIVMSNMMLQSIGKALKASIIAGARQGYFFIPLIRILAYAFGLLGVQMTQAAADVGTFILSVPLAISVLNEMKAAS